MKEGIHPKYGECTIACACGAVYKTRSTRGDFRIDICSACHPFFIGSDKQKLIDSEGRVDRFKKRYANVALRAVGKAAEAKEQPEG